MAEKNELYYGDNLDVLRRHIDDESVDLVYLDPPFKSNQNYNAFFAERDGTRSAAQIKAFEDTWRWDQAAARAYQETVETGGSVAEAMQSFRSFLGENDMLAYLSMMAPRLVELQRVLKDTGTIWLHCDPTASHYLKMLLDSVFGPKNFLNEIAWKRSSAHSDTKQGMRRCGKIHDVILVYGKTEKYNWYPVYTPYTEEYLESEYRHVAPDGRRYKETDLTAAKPGGDVEYEWRVKRKLGLKERWQADLTDEHQKPKPGLEYKGVRPYNGRFWAYSKANLIGFAKADKLIHRSTGMPRLVQYSDEMPGIPLQDLWDDIPPESGDRDLGYPTQKPEALLERILNSGTAKGDVVLDPFCGCGTTVSVAQGVERKWIGIDITQLAITLIRTRLNDAFGPAAKYVVIGEPVSLSEAQELAETNPYQFQLWALGLVHARPDEIKKGADRGIDGKINFHDEGPMGKTKHVIISIKGGHVTSSQVRDLVGTIDREKAQIGVFICIEEPSRQMRTEAASNGFYKSPWGEHSKIQILTIKDLLEGKQIDYPHTYTQSNVTFKRAKKAKKKDAVQITTDEQPSE